MKLATLTFILGLVVLAIGLAGVAIYQGFIVPGLEWRACQRSLEHHNFAEAYARIGKYLSRRPQDATAHLLAAQISRRGIIPVLPIVPSLSEGEGIGENGTPSESEQSALSYNEAVRHLSEYRRLEGANEASSLEWSLISAQQGQLQDLEHLRILIGQHHVQALLIFEALAKGYLVNYQLAEAEYCVHQWSELDPSPQALVLNGWLRCRNNDFPEAISSYRQALEAEPDNEIAERMLADVLVLSARPAEALERFLHLQSKHPNLPSVQVALAQCRNALGDIQEARTLLEGVLAVDADNAIALQELADIELKQKNPARAEIHARRAYKQMRWERKVIYVLCRALENNGKEEEARLYRDRLVDLEVDVNRNDTITGQIVMRTESADLPFEAGAILITYGLNKEGVVWLRSALRQDPQHAFSRQLLEGFDRIGQGFTKEALSREAHRVLATFYAASDDPKLKALAVRHDRIAKGLDVTSSKPGNQKTAQRVGERSPGQAVRPK